MLNENEITQLFHELMKTIDRKFAEKQDRLQHKNEELEFRISRLEQDKLDMRQVIRGLAKDLEEKEKAA